MTCHHAKGDPNCSSTVGGRAWEEQERYARQSADESRRKIEDKLRESSQEVARLQAALQKYQDATGTPEPPATPDSHNYEILEHAQVGLALVLKVQYPYCAKCAYEGVKVLVYEHTSVGDALLWRVIDPHFRDPNKARTKKEAPSPSARFPGSDLGWRDAISYAADVLGHRNSRPPNGLRCEYVPNSHGEIRCNLGEGHKGEHQYDDTSPSSEPYIILCTASTTPPGERVPWTCTRPKGHTGNHTNQKGYSWSQLEARVELCTATTEVKFGKAPGTVLTCSLRRGHEGVHKSASGDRWPEAP